MSVCCVILALVALLCTFLTGNAIQCYQCSSDQDKKRGDICGAYEEFDKQRAFTVDCLEDEAVTPGTFCYKSVQQSPRVFIWDGRWRTVVRRCASITERGVNQGCDWGYRENGEYWEECYCAQDYCNGAKAAKRGMTFTSLICEFVWCIALHYVLQRTH